MDSLIVWIVAFTALGGVLSVLAAAGFLLVPEARRTQLLGPLVSFAIGALLGASFLGLLPRALEGVGPRETYGITAAVLLGLLGFFLLEKMVLWRHCHVQDCDVHGGTNVGRSQHPASLDTRTSLYSAGTAGTSGATEVHGEADAATGAGSERAIVHAPNIEQARKAAAGNLILIGDGIHNFVDGVLIAAAFLTDIKLGVVTSLAVIAHEIPQELGDFAILLHSGFSRARALFYNVLSSLTTVVGGIAAYFSLALALSVVPYVLAIAASSFIYIAVADLIPGLHKRPEFSATVQQIGLIGLGVAVIVVADVLLH